MVDFASTQSSPKTQTFASAIKSNNAIKLSVATNVAAQDYSGAALDGAVGQGAISLPKTVSVTTGAHAATYKTGSANPIVFTGTDKDGNVITENVLLTQANGGETVSGSKGFASVTNIHTPGQNDALGTFQFGVRDIVYPLRAVRGGGAAATVVKVGYQDGSTDTLTMAITGQLEPVAAARVYDDGTTTSWPLTVYV